MADKIKATFSSLIMSIGASATMSLGLEAHPDTGQKSVNFDTARFNIDLLEVLQEKTKGNLDKEEEELLNHLVIELKMRYIQITKSS